jgi:hypothetical protein
MAESCAMLVSADIAGAGAIAGAAVSAGFSWVLQAATSATAATRARRFMWISWGVMSECREFRAREAVPGSGGVKR